MSKAVLISIKPEWVAKILNGEKTIEVRKTAPKCGLPIEVYVYCTKKWRIGETLIKHAFDGKYRVGNCVGSNDNEPLNGKVVAKFTLRKADTIYSLYPDPPYLGYMTNEDAKELLKRSCLSDAELTCYLGFSNGYAWHISDLEIFDKPKKLEEFYGMPKKINGLYGAEMVNISLSMAPQSWQYIEVE